MIVWIGVEIIYGNCTNTAASSSVLVIMAYHPSMTARRQSACNNWL
jgi:hypothetical protein